MSDYGRYQLTASIGRGRLTEVFKAKSFGVEGFEKTLVIKRFRPELLLDAQAFGVCLAAARQSMRLSHANVAQVFDMGEVSQEGRTSHYIATEYIPGLSLQTLLERSVATGVQFPEAALLFVATEIAKALDYAHRSIGEDLSPLEIVHGALTPNSVLISWDGEVKVSDFGLLPALQKQKLPLKGDFEALGRILLQMLGTHTETDERWALEAPAESLEPIRALALALCSGSELETPWSAARVYERLMEHAYSTRAQVTSEALSDFVEKFRVTPLSDPPAFFEGALEQRLESLPPQVILGQAEPAQLATEGSIAAFSLRFSDGPESALVQRIALEWLSRYGAQVVSQTPREIEAFWSAGDEPLQAVALAARSLLEILARAAKLDPDVSAGLEVGRVNLSGDTSLVDDEKRRGVFASTRALSLSLPARLCVSASVAEHLQSWFELEVLEPDAGVWFVGQLRPLHSATRFVGRKRELADLGSRLVAAVRGESRPVAIVGAGGVGKSRLLREMRRRLKKGTVSVGFYLVNCRTNSSNVPFAAVSDMLRKLCGVREHEVGEWAAAVLPRLRALGLGEDEIQSVLLSLAARPSGAAQFNAVSLQSGVAKMLHSLSLERPHLFAFDRAEHLDLESADLLAAVVSRLSRARTLLVFSGRTDHVGFLRKMPGYSEILLRTLAPEDIVRLVQHGTGIAEVPLGLVDFVVERSGGNPMFAIELLREGIEKGSIGALQNRSPASAEFFETGNLHEPGTLRDLLGQRLLALEAEARAVFAAVAVLDEPVDLASLADVVQLPLLRVLACVDELEGRGVLQRLSPATVAVAVQILAETVAQVIDPVSWRALHTRAAEVYAGLANTFYPEDIQRVAQHFEAAGKRDDASRAYGASGLQLLEHGMLERAARYLGRALALTSAETCNRVSVAAWVSGLARCSPHASFSEFGPAVVAAGELLLTATGDASLRLGAVVDAVEVLASLHRFREAEVLLEAALEKSAGIPKVARRGLTLAGTIAISRGEFPQAVRALERASELPAGFPQEQHFVLVAFAQALAGAGEHARAGLTLIQADELGAKVGLLEACQRARARAFLLASQGENGPSALAASRAAELARSSGFASELAQALSDETLSLLLANDLAKCYATGNRASEAAAQIGSARLLNVSRMSLAYLEGPRAAKSAESALREGLREAELQGWTGDVIFARYLLGRLLVQLRESEQGEAQLKLAFGLAQNVGNQRWVRVCGEALARS